MADLSSYIYIVANTAKTVGDITPASYASPAPSISGFDSISGVNLHATTNISAGGNIDIDGEATVGGNLVIVGNITFSGGGSITEVTSAYGNFYGNSDGSNALYAGYPGGVVVPGGIAAFTGDSNAYMQINAQNRNHGTQASMEYVVTGDLGSDTTDYLDLGFSSSTWDGTQDNSLGTAVAPRDGYMYVQGGGGGGNLVLGTTTAGREIKFVAGGPNAANNIANISNLGIDTLAIYTDNYYYANGSPLAIPSGNTSVTTTGNVSAGNISSTGNVTAGALKGDGGNISNVRGSNVNGAVSFATTANSVAAANVSGLGNLALLNKDGNASNVLYGNGVFSAVPATYGNSNVANYLPNYSGTLTSVGAVTANGTVTANNITSNGNVQVGSALVMYGSNNTIATVNGSAVQFANRVNFNATGNYSIVASGNVSASTYFGAIGTASQPNITSLGNLTSVVVTSNANVGGNLVLSNTTSIVSTPSSNGNITLDPDGTGVVNIVGAATANGNISTTSGTFVGNGAGLTNVTVNAAGNIQGTSSNVSLVAGSYTYTFDNTGNFTMPVNGNIVMPGANTNLTVGGNLTVTGNITSTPVGFRATTPVTNVSVNNGVTATMLFGTEEVDTNSAYNPATGRFTPNVAGYYAINWFIVTNANGAGELIASLNKNGVLVAWGTNQTTATAHWNGIGGSAGMIYLNGTTDYISITLTNNSGSTATILAASGLSYFSAYLIR